MAGYDDFFFSGDSVGKQLYFWVDNIESLGLLMDDCLKRGEKIDRSVLGCAIDYTVAVKLILIKLGQDFIDFVDSRASSPVELLISPVENECQKAVQGVSGWFNNDLFVKDIDDFEECDDFDDESDDSDNQDCIDETIRMLCLDALIKGACTWNNGLSK